MHFAILVFTNVFVPIGKGICTDSVLLTVLVLRHATNQGASLPELVGDIRAELEAEPASAQLFEASLALAGYLDEHAEKYESNKFQVIETRLYRVEDEFPRVRHEELPSGITNVKYDLDLSSLDAFSADYDVWLSSIRATETDE